MVQILHEWREVRMTLDGSLPYTLHNLKLLNFCYILIKANTYNIKQGYRLVAEVPRFNAAGLASVIPDTRSVETSAVGNLACYVSVNNFSLISPVRQKKKLFGLSPKI